MTAVISIFILTEIEGARNMFLFDLTYVSSLEEVEKLLPAHIRYLDTWYSKGKFLCSGRKNPRTGGVILCNCADRAEAEYIQREDPFYQEGIAQYSLTEFLPTKMAEGFQMLLR